MFDFLNKLPVVNEIMGSFGEQLAKFFSKITTDALVLHDVLIDGAEGYTSQIDLILVGGKGVYVVEVKSFPEAKIYGDVKKHNWSYYSHGKKYEIYSPIKQNQKHIEYLKEFLKVFGELPFFSIVCMICDDFKISGELDGKTAICSSFPIMQKALYKLGENAPFVLDDQKKNDIYEYIKNKQHIGKEARREHKKNVIAYKELKKEMDHNKICPFCKSPLVLRNGKNGEFYGCKNFPKCRYTQKKD